MGHHSLSIPSHTHVPGPHNLIYRSWANNCDATNSTNGVKRTSDSESSEILIRAALPDTAESNSAVGLPDEYLPTIKATKGSTGPTKAYILPGNNTGVVRVLQFSSVLSEMTY